MADAIVKIASGSFTGKAKNTGNVCDIEGQKIEVANALRQLGPCSRDVIWVHPTSKARLFCGNLTTALSQEVLESDRITRIVTCTGDLDPESSALYARINVVRFHYHIARFRDRPQKGPEGVARFFAPLLGWVAQELAAGESILIHCLAGAHRAGTAAVACLMFFAGLKADEATKQAHAIRDCIDPSICDIGFDKLLRKLQRSMLLGLVPPAIEEARGLGFAAADEFQFMCLNQWIRCCCCSRKRLEPQLDKVAPAPDDDELEKTPATLVTAPVEKSS